MNAATVKRPTDQELADYKKALSIDQVPDDFLRTVTEIGAKIATEEIWGSRYKFVREAMTLAEFTKLSPVETVRLGEDPPDGWIGTPEQQRVEITEVIEPGRKRGDEYKIDRFGKLDDVSMEELETRIEKIEPALDHTIGKKVGKYEPAPKLLVYLNMVHHGRAEKAVEDAIDRQKAKHGNAFNGIHVIWKAKLY